MYDQYVKLYHRFGFFLLAKVKNKASFIKSKVNRSFLKMYFVLIQFMTNNRVNKFSLEDYSTEYLNFVKVLYLIKL